MFYLINDNLPHRGLYVFLMLYISLVLFKYKGNVKENDLHKTHFIKPTSCLCSNVHIYIHHYLFAARDLLVWKINHETSCTSTNTAIEWKDLNDVALKEPLVVSCFAFQDLKNY